VGVDRPPSLTLGRCPYEGGSQGLGKVAICTEWPNVPVPGIWLPAWTDAATLPRLRRVGHRMNRTNRQFAGALGIGDAPCSRRGGGRSDTGQLGHDLGSARFRLSHQQAEE
jgi:hypothetical protein